MIRCAILSICISAQTAAAASSLFDSPEWVFSEAVALNVIYRSQWPDSKCTAGEIGGEFYVLCPMDGPVRDGALFLLGEPPSDDVIRLSPLSETAKRHAVLFEKHFDMIVFDDDEERDIGAILSRFERNERQASE